MVLVQCATRPFAAGWMLHMLGPMRWALAVGMLAARHVSMLDFTQSFTDDALVIGGLLPRLGSEPSR